MAAAIVLQIIGILGWLFAGFIFMSSLSGGTDLQLILSGVWAVFGAVCLGSGAIVQFLDGVQSELKAANTKKSVTEKVRSER